MTLVYDKAFSVNDCDSMKELLQVLCCWLDCMHIQLDMCTVERGICPIAESIMTNSHFSMRMCETALFLLPVGNLTVKMVNLRHRAKFRGDRLNPC